MTEARPGSATIPAGPPAFPGPDIPTRRSPLSVRLGRFVPDQVTDPGIGPADQRDGMTSTTHAASTEGGFELPDILLSPPWRTRQRAPRSPALPALAAPSEAPPEVSLAWLPGERESWAVAARPFVPPEGWQPTIDAIVGQEARPAWGALFAAFGPEDEVRALMPGWLPCFGAAQDLARVFVARFGAEALPAVAASHATRRVHLAQPFADPGTADFMADALVRLRVVRRPARAWLERHPDYAARWLVPVALGQVPAGVSTTRATATAALRRLVAVSSGSFDVLAAARDAYGAEVAARVRDLLDDGGLSQFPRVMPALPAWAEPSVLPEVSLRGGAPVPAEAVRTIVQMLTISRPDAPYAGLSAVQESCDPTSLAALAWTLFEGWQEAGSPAKERWAFEALAPLGDDATVRRLAAAIPTWSLARSRRPAHEAMDLLATVGTRAALTALHEMSRRAKQAGVREYAAAKIAESAEAQDLSADQLADRVAPDLGLDAAGTLVLDFGPRRFVVSFDGQLVPRVRDEAGKPFRNLPKPGARDDAALAAAAVQRFSALRKEAGAATAEQISRLEHALWARRRWSVAEFRELLVAHPLLGHLVRRLVWAVFDGDAPGTASAIAAFRVAEDGTFADIREDLYLPPESAAIGVAHPLDLGTDLAAWAGILADYDILQPFAQLDRPVFALTGPERESRTLERFGAVSVDPRRTVLLERRGWRRGPVNTDYGWDSMERPVAEGMSLILHLSPGMRAGHVTECERQHLASVWIHRPGRGRWQAPEDALPLGTLDPAVASELVRDLTEATAP